MLYKFFDDQGVYLAVIITYYALLSVVPLLLLATSVLGFVLSGDPELRTRVLDSAVSDFPVVGDQLGRPEGLQGSVGAIVIGGAFALYGSLGLGTAVQNALLTAWAVPRNNRPNPVLLRVRSLLLLVAGGLAVLAVSSVSTLAQVVDRDPTGLLPPEVFRWTGPVISGLAVTVVVALLLWLGAGRRHSLRRSFAGALVIALLWQLIQLGGTRLVGRSVREASEMNATFGVVLGLIAVTYLASVSLVLGVETNVVLHRRLWPRALLTPFTDAVALTDADRRAYADYAKAQRHKGFERVRVEFEDRDRDRDDRS
ncbi:YihY/virulence factor BrkB family protein [Nocardioides litoris]|uniref:YihY/virulence factor BrkB family protein n=1 Tax=Nocardioides litoris TaxID=1926648 RepID=UPI001B875B65|nr:YhjD/YihY/BrkB family envelope integrity protein [Nocardioides litoris]